MRPGDGVHAMSGVGHDQADIAARPEPGAPFVRASSMSIASTAMRQRAARGHRFAGIDGQIRDDVFDLARVGVDGGRSDATVRFSAMRSPRNLAAAAAPRSTSRSSDERLEREHLPPAVRQQLAGQRTRARRRSESPRRRS